MIKNQRLVINEMGAKPLKEIINELLDNSKLLQLTSENAVKLAERFDWKNVIGDWEKVINNLYNGK